MVRATALVERTSTESNGDQFWRREFDYHESVERVNALEKRGTQFQVKVGLELLRVKTQILKHGEFAQFVYRAGFDNMDTPERRLKVARSYMTFLGLIDSPKPINPDELKVLEALDIAYSENPRFADFDSYRRKNRDPVYVYDAMYPEGAEATERKGDPYEVLGFNPFLLHKRILRRFDHSSPSQKVDTITLVWNTMSQLQVTLDDLRERLPEFEVYLADLQKQGEIARQLSAAVNEIKAQEWDTDLAPLGPLFERLNDQKAREQ